jgi:hypothetical protein
MKEVLRRNFLETWFLCFLTELFYIDAGPLLQGLPNLVKQALVSLHDLVVFVGKGCDVVYCFDITYLSR